MNGIAAHNDRFLSIDHKLYLHKQGQTILPYLKELQNKAKSSTKKNWNTN